MKIKVLGCPGAELPGFGLPSFLLDDSILIDAGTT
ncbi:MAG TPA: 3',5'-cyclic-nucleotide phosphodiesterase, partial [Nitrospirae bacterium]|nr:3',5'-cyclic-nucleotide phosphodiesterase [Nitrospirota bacterium]